MKFFYNHFTQRVIILFLLIGITVSSATILNSWAIHEEYSPTQEIPPIPSWIKKTVGWWADGKVTEVEFLQGITYLINNRIIVISDSPTFRSADNTIDAPLDYRIPKWIKNTAGWWADGDIPDSAFVSGIQWLIKNGIMQISIEGVSFIPIDDIVIADIVGGNKHDFIHLYSALFETYVHPEQYMIDDTDGNKKWISPILGLNPYKMDHYNEIALWHDDSQKAVVVFPLFTATAYAPGGFYDYFTGKCDDCTTTTIKQPGLEYTSSGNAIQVFDLLGYDLISDEILDKNPGILKNYHKVIMLHNEYVTRAMFDAVTSHPKVLYLYPNALYAEIDVNYTDNTITLIRGHDYPPEDPVSNGFDWEFDNTHPYEYDNECLTMQFYPIEDPRSNVGLDAARYEPNTHWMTTCYPDIIFYSNDLGAYNLLKAIKEL
jgi:hypothetical protein